MGYRARRANVGKIVAIGQRDDKRQPGDINMVTIAPRKRPSPEKAENIGAARHE
jgi:hypothetical protein